MLVDQHLLVARRARIDLYPAVANDKQATAVLAVVDDDTAFFINALDAQCRKRFDKIAIAVGLNG